MVAASHIIVFVLSVSFFTFVAFFGRLPALRSSPIGWLHRLIWRYLPKQFARLDDILTNGRISRAASRLYRYILYEKHPLVVVFFLTLLTGGASLFLYDAWQYLPLKHCFLVSTLIPLPYVFLHLSNRTTPTSQHIVTPENHAEQMAQYPYDFQLFHPNITCRTCMLPKPPRSKHCSLCRACVARADHHCIWVNNCLGRGNYRWFLSLLLSTSILLAYGAYLAYLTLAPQIRAHMAAYPDWHRSGYEGRQDRTGRILYRLDIWLDVLSTAFDVGGVCRGGVGFLALLTSPLPAGLLAYHIYLIWAGMTTNESGKWSDWKEDVTDRLVWSTRVDKTSEEYRQAWVDWPKRSGRFMVLTNDGTEPRLVMEEITRVVEGGRDAVWERVKSLDGVDNIYDLGLWGNVVDLLTN